MQKDECIVCGNSTFKKRFSKESEFGDMFTLVCCTTCGLEFLNPQPDEDEMHQYYSRRYFTTRTDRGYDNYFSTGVRSEIERVMELNLHDLDFFTFEDSLKSKRALDIGCAAGYFVNYLHERGWHAEGIDVSEDCVEFAREKLGLAVEQGDYLTTEYLPKFNLITLWATIEHLHCPERVLEKIYTDLEEDGRLFISTCRSGGINFMRVFGPRWRFYNFPEHLFFFSAKTICRLFENNGFRVTEYYTYGSGVGKGGSLIRKTADFLAKNCFMGDMMLLSAVKA